MFSAITVDRLMIVFWCAGNYTTDRVSMILAASHIVLGSFSVLDRGQIAIWIASGQ
jgi:hypothetical protein